MKLLAKSIKIKKYYLLVLLSFFFITGISCSVNAANNLKSSSDLLQEAGDGAGYMASTGPESIFDFVGLIIQIALSFLGVIFIVLMVYGGYMWMTARGNEEQVKKAQGVIKNAVIGLVIVIAAYAISYFVVQSLSTTALNPTTAE